MAAQTVKVVTEREALTWIAKGSATGPRGQVMPEGSVYLASLDVTVTVHPGPKPGTKKLFLTKGCAC